MSIQVQYRTAHTVLSSKPRGYIVLTSIRPTEDHRKWKDEEAALVEQDRSTAGLKGGLFRGCFWTHMARRPIIRVHPIRDAEDGVERCPACTWELEDGRCESCGYSFETDTDIMTDSDTEYPHGADMDDDLLEALAEEDLAHDHTYGGAFYDDGETSDEIAFDLLPPTVRRRLGHRVLNPDLGPYSPTLAPGSPPDSFYDGTNYGSEDEDDGSSLEGFVVDDDPHADHISPRGSPRSAQWETDEGSGMEEAQAQDSNFELNNQIDNDSENNRPSFAIAQHNSQDDSDEGPIAPSSRRQRLRQTSGSSGSEASQPLTSIRNRSFQNANTSHNQRSIPHRSTAARQSGGRSRGVPIEIVSDSDSPVPPQRQRRRRGLPNRILSDDDSGVEASSGTATLGRRSPRPRSGPRNQRVNRPPISQTSNASSPISVVSDAPVSENEGSRSPPERFSYASIAASTTSERSYTNGEANRTLIVSNDGAHSPSQGSIAHLSSPHTHLSPHSIPQRRQTNRLQSPLPPRPNRHGPPRPSISPMRPQERFEQGVRDRAAAKAVKKAERRRLKAERDQRQAAQAGPSNASLQTRPSWSFDD